MRKISLLLIALIVFSIIMSLSSCTDTKFMDPPTINGVSLAEFTIVYDFDGLDYNKRAAEYIKSRASEQYNVKLAIVDDDTPKGTHEIVVGETSRDISASLEAETDGLEFSVLASDGSIALEGDYFVIAAAAYFFVETYASGDGSETTVPETVSVYTPIVKEAKNFIMLIGDGMGVYHTKMFDYLENNCDYSDGEDLFYGYMLPYLGSSRTDSRSGTTDSAAGGTALACGYKTLNGYVGMNIAQKPVKSLTELASEMGKATAVMSTEVETGATPSTFLAHVTSRSFTSALTNAILRTQEEYGTVVDCGFDYYNAKYMETIEDHVEATLDEVSKNENGFFLMYEEAHTDKHSHDNDMDKTFQALIRFNQVIARFMEFAFYNPETFILITADHETGELYPEANELDPDGKEILVYHYDDHSSADVPVFVYGYHAGIFDEQNIENIQIAHTIAALMGDENFGDQKEFQSLTKK